jgi:hypothetical protein
VKRVRKTDGRVALLRATRLGGVEAFFNTKFAEVGEKRKVRQRIFRANIREFSTKIRRMLSKFLVIVRINAEVVEKTGS